MVNHDRLIDELLEKIDTYSVKKLRELGSPINQLVYHGIMYKAFDDDMRIVYSSIIRKMNFI